MTDFTANFLTRIRNAQMARHERLTAPASNMTVAITHILKREGFIENYKVIEGDKRRLIRVHLRYLRGRNAAVRGILKVSRPGRRHYVGVEDIPRVRGGLGIAILSTSKGLLTGREARKQRVGGELICKVW